MGAAATVRLIEGAESEDFEILVYPIEMGA
jgi:hypothetical protein